MKRYLHHLLLEKMKIKTTMRHQLNLVRKTIIKKTRCGEWEMLCTVGRSVNFAATMASSMDDPQKLKMELLYDLAILLLGIHANETKIPFKKVSAPHKSSNIICTNQDFECVH